MPTIVWILLWAVVLGLLAFFVVREVRSGRRGPAEVDRLKNPAVREAELNRDARGPNGGSSLWTG